MKFPCVIELDTRGNPKIKVTSDAPEVTVTVYTEDINMLKSWVGTELEIGPKK